MAYDAILVPGGGVRDSGVLPPWVAARFDRALQVSPFAGYFMPLSQGTPHRPPPLNADGYPITEARAGADYLMRRGVDPARILIEESSFDTIGNAYFTRVIHVIPRALERLLVVTSAFHMPRTEAVFRWVYALDGPGPRCSLDFESVADDGIEPDALAARLAKEAESLAAFQTLPSRIRSLAELHAWMFAEHRSYAAGPRRPTAVVDRRTY